MVYLDLGFIFGAMVELFRNGWGEMFIMPKIGRVSYLWIFFGLIVFSHNIKKDEVLLVYLSNLAIWDHSDVFQELIISQKV